LDVQRFAGAGAFSGDSSEAKRFGFIYPARSICAPIRASSLWHLPEIRSRSQKWLP
jgi:hypothetical protein